MTEPEKSLPAEFAEIDHSGGVVTFHVTARPSGPSSLEVEYAVTNDKPLVVWGVYALPQGIPVSTIHFAGLGQPWNPPPMEGCVPVFIASDTQGRFGHHCQRCSGYWRSGPRPRICPYCGRRASSHNLLSLAQQEYVRHYCEVLQAALKTVQSGSVSLDLNRLAKESKGEHLPPFYLSEKSQQRQFTCTSCQEFNDILGRYGYCSNCGMRNDLAEFENSTVQSLRCQLNSGLPTEVGLRTAIAGFDSMVAQYAKELATRVPMSHKRRARLLERPFHKLDEIRDVFLGYFDIDICAGLEDRSMSSVRLSFHRRHVYEHNGGEVDQKYLDESGDNSVRLKQTIRETLESTHTLLGNLAKIAKNLHLGFHELIPTIPLDSQGPPSPAQLPRKR